MRQMARMRPDGLIRFDYIRAMRLAAVVVTLCLLLVGCGARTAAPEPANPWPEEPLAVSLPSVDPEEYLYLFDYDTAAPLDVQEVERWHESRATWTDLTYASPRGGRVPATLIVPDGRGPFAGMVLMHGGAADSNRRDLFLLAAGYARMGAVVVLIDAPFARPENRNPPRRYGPTTWTEQDREEMVQLIVNLRRAVDLLAARPDVDAQRMAYVGNSSGGATGGLLAGVEDRLPAYALVVGDGGWVEHYTGPDDRHSYPVGPFFTLSEEGQRRWLEAMWPIEPIHYVGRAAPAALLFQNGTRDVNVPPRDALRFQQAGALCAYPAHLWMAGRGLVGWRAMPAVAEAAGEGEQVARRPRWYEALGVVLSTYAALVVAIGAALVIITDLPIGEIVRLLAAGS